ncbi:arabidopsis phospholipase-like protein [Striga asiatica]|uniref:Arabidopsis phospholipase-like protein n=1 Tax=Striga asiatica TaxID=4170 RepID=A0A5A7PBR4_STRAF|nr:arabidopsis phospholipase-like protein [Striga asiatica]
MVKREDNASFTPDSFSPPDAPPGFPPQPTRNSAAADVDTTGDQNPGDYRKRSVSPEWYWPRRTSRKRSRPDFYKPPPARTPPLAEGPRRRGRPPKARLVSPLLLFHLAALKETEARNPNQASSNPSQKLQEHVLCFSNKSSHTSKELSSSDADSQLIEPSHLYEFKRKNNLNWKTSDIVVSEKQAGEATEIFNFQNRNVDPKILHIANALDQMPVSTVNHSKLDLTRMLESINKKHGDITQDSVLESDCMKTFVLLGICNVMLDLERKQLNDIDVRGLVPYYTAVWDAENMKVNVQWLHERLDEIMVAVKLTDEEKVLVDEKKKRLVNLDMKKEELELRKGQLERLRSEVNDLEAHVAREVVMVEELNRKIGARQSRYSEFQHAYLMDGLV